MHLFIVAWCNHKSSELEYEHEPEKFATYSEFNHEKCLHEAFLFPLLMKWK